MSENWIQRVSIRRTAEHGETFVRAEAVCSIASQPQTVTSSGESVGINTDSASLTAIEDRQLSKLRKRLYDAGFSKRAIATAVKNVKRMEH